MAHLAQISTSYIHVLVACIIFRKRLKLVNVQCIRAMFSDENIDKELSSKPMTIIYPAPSSFGPDTDMPSTTPTLP